MNIIWNADACSFDVPFLEGSFMIYMYLLHSDLVLISNIQKTGLAFAEDLAIDYSTGNLYYTAEGPTTFQSYIGVVQRSTSFHKTLINYLYKPRGIALHSAKG